MLTRRDYRIAGLMIVFSSLIFAQCTSNEEKVEEVVQPEVADTPGTPEDVSGAAPTASTVYFAFDDYTLNSSAQNELTRLSDQLKSNKSAVVQIQGHCDERGSIEYNLALGQKRADSVRDYLIQVGVESARLSTISYGEEKPAADGHDEAAWSKNRRAEFVISSAQ